MSIIGALNHLLFKYLDYATEKSHTDYSYRAELTIREIRHEDTGVYSCRVRRLTMEAEPYKYINLTITVAGTTHFFSYY